MGSVVCMDERVAILEYNVRIPTVENLDQMMDAFCHQNQLQSIVFLSVDILEEAMDSVDYRERISKFQFILPGEEEILFMHSTKRLKEQGMLGSDDCLKHILHYLEKGNKTIYLVGDKIEKLEYFYAFCQECYPDLEVVGTFVGDEKMDDENLLNDINVTCPDVILTAIAPQLQENWILNNVAKLNGRVCIGADVLVRHVVKEYIEKIEKENYNRFYCSLELLKDKFMETCQRRIFQMDYVHYMKKKEKDAKMSRVG